MKEKKIYLSTKDYSVSGEEFRLLYNDKMEMLETFPQPTSERLPDYYKSENYISHTDGKRNFLEKVYHFVKSISLKRKLKLINSISLNGKNLLDFGCGTGDFLKVAQNNDWEITGIEPNEGARHIANLKTANAVFDGEHFLKLKRNSFDVITLWHVLEHLPDLEKHLSIFKNLLKQSGVLIIAVPNFKSYDAQYYKKFWAAFDVPRHLWHFSKQSITSLAEIHGMEVTQIHPMYFDAYYVSLLSEKYRSGKFNPFNAFRVGWLSNLKAKQSGEHSSLIYIIKHH